MADAGRTFAETVDRIAAARLDPGLVSDLYLMPLESEAEVQRLLDREEPGWSRLE